DAKKQTLAVLRTLEERGYVQRDAGEEDRDSLLAEAVQHALERFDEIQRDLASKRYQEFERELGQKLTRFVVAETVSRFRAAGDLDWPPGLDEEKQIDDLARKLAPAYGPWLARQAALEDVAQISRTTAQAMHELGALKDPVAALELRESPFTGI